MAEHWYTIEHGPNDVDVADGTGSLIACELLPDRAALIAAAPETAAERDRLREINAELLTALKGCRQYLVVAIIDERAAGRENSEAIARKDLATLEALVAKAEAQ